MGQCKHCGKSVPVAIDYCSYVCAQKSPRPAKVTVVSVPQPDPAVLFFEKLEAAGLPLPRTEWEFSSAGRGWKSDYAWPDPRHMLALEVEGGAYIEGGGRHNRASSFIAEMEKYNALACEGFRLIRCIPGDLLKPSLIELVRLALLTG